MKKIIYITGDQVYIHGSVRIIENCDGYYATFYDEYERLQEVNVNVIENIPLTPKMLEKSGWKITITDVTMYHKDGLTILEANNDGSLHFICNNINVTLESVSDLQHLLFAFHRDNNKIDV